ncbi:hypothetical protein MVEG_11688 [Podila verticillata NRRL 6337]|uniref:Peptidase A1 domain-containing protein n=1 Tax=Podila verticillata NRRL 6337 TaxID=1069443 RepID=A0A086TKK2_9FUNG|nr:hypothetical protein MVEG_11688 [Podila verticillata NRRL 6337]
MIAKFDSAPREQRTSPRPFSRVEQPPQPRRIDAERVPIQYNPSQTAFIGNVGIGTPPQYFHLQFDIASSDAWVVITKVNCTPINEDVRPCPPHRRYFHPNRSSTFEKTPNAPWSLEFGDQSRVFGNLHTDVVQAAGFVIDRQVFGVGESLFGFKDNGIDGSLGLGLSELSATGRSVSGWDPGTEAENSCLDTSRYTGELTYYDVPVGSVYWSVPVHSLIVVPPPPPSPPKPAPALKASGTSGKVIITTDTSPSPPVPTSARTLPPPAPPLQVNGRIGSGTKLDMPNIIFDTSSNLILLPPRVAAATHRYIHNLFFGLYSGYSFLSGSNRTSSIRNSDNATTTDNPSHPSQYRFKVTGKDLVRERVPVVGGIFNLCFSGIQASKSDEDDWVFGNIWFLSNYMTLNHRDRKMGIAPTDRPELEV